MINESKDSAFAWIKTTIVAEPFIRWTKASASSDKKAKELFSEFMEKTVIQSNGDPDFQDQMEALIKSCSKLATGAQILSNILLVSKQVNLVHHEENTFYNESNSEIYFGYHQKDNYYLTRDKNGEIEIEEYPLTALLLHEMLHKLNHHLDSKKFKRRLKTESEYSKDMDNQEEELVIRGKIRGGEKSPYCSENKILKELGYRKRINHRGISKTKGTLPTLDDMLRLKAKGSIRKQLAAHPDSIDTTEISNKTLQQLKKKLPGFEISISDFPELVILSGDVDVLKMMIECGWSCQPKHIEKAKEIYSMLNELYHDQRKPKSKREFKVSQTNQVTAKSRSNAKKVVDFLDCASKRIDN